jgi:hypothetical protein
MTNDRKIVAFCTQCGRTQGVFSNYNEMILKIAEQGQCKDNDCNTPFSFSNDGTIYDLGYREIPIDSSNTKSNSPTNEGIINQKANGIPFVSMSFDPADQEINNYVTGILRALKIDYETGERYSKESISEKVKNRIETSGLLIGILVNRDKVESGGFATSGWLVKEVGLAQGNKKDVILWVEKDIKDIAGLNYEKEIIYFNRKNLPDMQKATLQFLEALKVHKLI